MDQDQIAAMLSERGPYVFDRMFAAVEKVRERLERACGALNAARVPYAVIGGNAVAAWVATIDEGAVRNTRDVDILLDRDNIDAASTALQTVGFHRDEAIGITVFLDGADGLPSQGLHVIWADEKVREHDACAAPKSDQTHDIEGKQIVDLLALIRMKLVAHRDKDRVHIRDMIGVGLIDESWVNRLADWPELASRLRQLLDDPDG